MLVKPPGVAIASGSRTFRRLLQKSAKFTQSSNPPAFDNPMPSQPPCRRSLPWRHPATLASCLPTVLIGLAGINPFITAPAGVLAAGVLTARVLAAGVLAAGPPPAQNTADPAADLAGDRAADGNQPLFPSGWPHWRGPHRNGHTSEQSGYVGNPWPGKELWRTAVGEGGTSPLVVAGKVYVLGYRNGQDTLHCLSAEDGRTLWQQSYRCPQHGRRATGDQGLYSGPTATPEFDPQTKLLYTLSCDGDLNCWDTTNQGKKVWGLNLYDRYQVPRRPRIGRRGLRDYGYTVSPLIFGKQLLVEVGAAEALVIALDKKTGQQLWKSQAAGPAGHHGGMVLLTVGRKPALATLTINRLVVLWLAGPDRGQTVGVFPWATEFGNNIASPVGTSDRLLITSGYNKQAMVCLQVTSGGIEQVWKTNVFSKICSPVIHQGRAYWASRQMHAVDLKTGQLLWATGQTGDAGSCLVTADDKLICWVGRGRLLLVDLSDQKRDTYQLLASQDTGLKADVWPHVVLSHQRLFLKDRRGNLLCLSCQRVQPSLPKHPISLPKARFSKERLALAPAAALLFWDQQMGEKVGGALAKKAAAGNTPDSAAGGWQLEAQDRQVFQKGGALDLRGRIVRFRGAEKSLTESCRKSNQLTLEAVVVADNARQNGPARIVSFSTDPYRRNFTLGQEGRHYILRLRTTKTGENGRNPEIRLGRVRLGQRQHILVTYRPGQLVAYLDGEQVLNTDVIQGDFSTWTVQTLVVGDEVSGGRDWAGTLQRLALSNRFVTEPMQKKGPSEDD